MLMMNILPADPVGVRGMLVRLDGARQVRVLYHHLDLHLSEKS
jgi:hypothetical protein